MFLDYETQLEVQSKTEVYYNPNVADILSKYGKGVNVNQALFRLLVQIQFLAYPDWFWYLSLDSKKTTRNVKSWR